MEADLTAYQDCDGAYAILLSQTGETNGGTVHEGVGAPTSFATIYNILGS